MLPPPSRWFWNSSTLILWRYALSSKGWTCHNGAAMMPGPVPSLFSPCLYLHNLVQAFVFYYRSESFSIDACWTLFIFVSWSIGLAGITNPFRCRSKVTTALFVWRIMIAIPCAKKAFYSSIYSHGCPFTAGKLLIFGYLFLRS